MNSIPTTSDISELTSESSLLDFSIGTGRTIFISSLIPALLSAEQEVILATCFWAPGPTLESLSAALKELSRSVISQNRQIVKIYICLSSRSLLQKLFHTSSVGGYIYPSDSWTNKLGLPAESELPGLEVQIKSLFFRPFSVLHSKYLIVDRQDVYLPSCNVSWEEWYECCIHLRGPIVGHVFEFWKRVWDVEGLASEELQLQHDSLMRLPLVQNAALHPLKLMPFSSGTKVATILLPHLHNSSLRHSVWFLSRPLLPGSPLNKILLHLFASAKESITLLTPNLTSRPVYNAIIDSLQRGVDVRIITNKKMMILEQILTSGTITEFWLWRLRRAYRKHVREQQNRDVEQAGSKVGQLKLQYFSPPIQTSDPAATTNNVVGKDVKIAAAAKKTHIKLTLVDDETIVLGSGNMDRASWYTSQELGIMLQGRDIVREMYRVVEEGLDGCLERYA